MHPPSTKAPTKKPPGPFGRENASEGPQWLARLPEIQAAIRKRIDAGQLHSGDAVASERDLAKFIR